MFLTAIYVNAAALPDLRDPSSSSDGPHRPPTHNAPPPPERISQRHSASNPCTARDVRHLLLFLRKRACLCSTRAPRNPNTLKSIALIPLDRGQLGGQPTIEVMDVLSDPARCAPATSSRSQPELAKSFSSATRVCSATTTPANSQEINILRASRCSAALRLCLVCLRSIADVPSVGSAPGRNLLDGRLGEKVGGGWLPCSLYSF